ncbi:hypothetical protein [Azospirillum griseum]|uniref:hypothetical protein n=1 Tax=Azospirillum griseum TaxID=2496639 RepID=UPI00131544AF|nr:hypothetical protein [Azospirillum griseum]
MDERCARHFLTITFFDFSIKNFATQECVISLCPSFPACAKFVGQTDNQPNHPFVPHPPGPERSQTGSPHAALSMKREGAVSGVTAKEKTFTGKGAGVHQPEKAEHPRHMGKYARENKKTFKTINNHRGKT